MRLKYRQASVLPACIKDVLPDIRETDEFIKLRPKYTLYVVKEAMLSEPPCNVPRDGQGDRIFKQRRLHI